MHRSQTNYRTREVSIGHRGLIGNLAIPPSANGLVIFAHGSGSSRLSPRNTMVARKLTERNLATLLFDLLTDAEARDRANVFDISLLASRLAEAIAWARSDADTSELRLGLFGASTGAAAALIAASECPSDVSAIVSRGGRPDLAGEFLPRVKAPTLLIVGGADTGVIELNEVAYGRLRCTKRLEIIAGATHLFEEPGTLEQVVELSGSWFLNYLSRAAE